jgi:DNA-binding Xre family transcriptional regulator
LYIVENINKNKIMVIDSLKLKSKIVRKGLTYETLAESVGVTKTTIFNVVNKGDTKVSTLLKICNALGCLLDDVVIKEFE